LTYTVCIHFLIELLAKFLGYTILLILIRGLVEGNMLQYVGF